MACQSLCKVRSETRTRLNWKKDQLVTIRHDGAKPNNGGGNAEYFANYLTKYGWNMKLETQCPQSPDVNASGT